MPSLSYCPFKNFQMHINFWGDWVLCSPSEPPVCYTRVIFACCVCSRIIKQCPELFEKMGTGAVQLDSARSTCVPQHGSTMLPQ